MITPTDLGEIVTEIGFLLDQGDQTVLNLEEDCGAGLDLLGEGAIGRNGELLATTPSQLMCTAMDSSHIRPGRVGIEINVVNGEDVVFRVGAILYTLSLYSRGPYFVFSYVERVLARYRELVVLGHHLLRSAKQRVGANEGGGG